MLPEDAFQTYVADTRAKGEELTSAAVLRLAKPYLLPSKARVQRWCIEDDVEAFIDQWDQRWPHWQAGKQETMLGRGGLYWVYL